MELNTYLYFENNCREAFDLYRQVFRGELSRLTTYAEAPTDLPSPPASETDRIMYVELRVGKSRLTGSDRLTGFGPQNRVGNNFCVAISVESREETDRICEELSKEGQVWIAPRDVFWGAYFAMFTDRFGVNWTVSCDDGGGAS